MNFDSGVVQVGDFVEYCQREGRWSTPGTVEGWYLQLVKAAVLLIG